METIEIETVSEPAAGPAPTMAVATIQSGAVGRALSVTELHERLEFVRQVMKQEMREGQDYGKIPGTGDKPSLLQPGAQKLLMTFNLREQIKKETLREIPHPKIPGHREYEFTITVFPSGTPPENGWDGVGTCSTFESKYRYRKAERRCPKCGKATIINEKPEYVRGREPGFLCYKKKGGCGEMFHKEHPDIVKQNAEDVENEDPADCWNTVRKMAFKRALVAAAINATNTSELWTQDVEDMAENRGSGIRKPENPPGQSKGVSIPTQAAKTAPTPKPASPPGQTRAAKPAVFADYETQKRMIDGLKAKGLEKLATEYFQKLDTPCPLMPNEGLVDLPLQFVPVTRRQFDNLLAAITDFGNGAEARHAFTPNPLPPEPEKKKQAPKSDKPGQAPANPPKSSSSTQVTSKPAEAPKSAQEARGKDPEWFWDVICPIPNKGQKREEYMKSPDTIRSLYHAMKTGDDQAQKRLWGFAKHWNPEPREYGGRVYPVSQADKVFRQALDDFCEWHDKHGKDTENPDSRESHAGTGAAGARPQEADPGAGTGDDDLPF